MNSVYFYPKDQFTRNDCSCSLATLALIFDILFSVLSLVSIYIDLVLASLIYGDVGLIYCIIFSSFSIIKYSSIIFDWVIYGVYESHQSLSPSFIKVSIIMMIFYLVCICPYTLLFVFIVVGGRPTFILRILNLFFNPYLVPHYLLITSIIINLKFVNSQKISKYPIVLEKEMQKFIKN